MTAGAGPRFVVRPARPSEWAEALALAFRDEAPSEQQARVANALPMLSSAELPADGLLVASDGAGILGAMICLPTAGAGALVWPPGAAPGPERERVEDALVAAALDWLRRRGSKLAQALLGTDEDRRGLPLLRGGFRRVTRLWYLRNDLRAAAVAPAQHRLRLEPVSAANAERFRATLLRTYESSHDCPEVNDVRTVEETLAAHRAQGPAELPRWWLAHAEAGPIGVLLLAPDADGQVWEIAYLGVVPAGRRQGLGSELVAHAVREALAGGARQLSLSVDARNAPAWALYRRSGFRPYAERQVYLALLGG